MSTGAIFFLGLFVVALLVVFVLLTIHEMRRSPAVMLSYGEPPEEVARRRVRAEQEDLAISSSRPLRILVATDGSSCSDRAVQSVAMRPWPAETQIEVVTVVYTGVPAFPDPQLMIQAAHVQALEADRQRAPARVQRAQRALAGRSGVTVMTQILEGEPEKVLLEEVEHWKADLLVVGSQGFGPMKASASGFGVAGTGCTCAVLGRNRAVSGCRLIGKIAGAANHGTAVTRAMLALVAAGLEGGGRGWKWLPAFNEPLWLVGFGRVLDTRHFSANGPVQMRQGFWAHAALLGL